MQLKNQFQLKQKSRKNENNYNFQSKHLLEKDIHNFVKCQTIFQIITYHESYPTNQIIISLRNIKKGFVVLISLIVLVLKNFLDQNSNQV